MLDRGDAAVLVAPVANFYHELDRMQLSPSPFRIAPSTNSFAEESLQAETADLRAALKKAHQSDDETKRIITSHLAEREKLQAYVEATAPAYPNGNDESTEPLTPPKFPSISVVEGLPAEFADYFRGVIAWSNPALADKSSARQAWETILNLPPERRAYKSTWAAFMLARSWETEDANKARDYYKQVRDLAAQGFSDPVGLAAASLGQEARVALRTNDFHTAIDLYLQQYAANGWGAGNSLRVAIHRALRAGPNALTPLAANPRLRRVVTAYLISQQPGGEAIVEFREETKAWLQAVETADVKDMELAEQFALAAYQADEIDLAVRWVNRAPNSPTAQWLAAKLLLRAGKVDQATKLLSQIGDSFPVEQSTNEPTAATPFVEVLSVPDTTENESVIAGRYIRGELGALRLSRREYIQSLDLLLRGGFWQDAAYVADRVLTTDELKNYVDANWPAITPSDNENKSPSEKELEQSTKDIRYLLARRLTRESHGPEARPYFPPERQAAHEQLLLTLNDAWNESLAGDQRAKALAAAAFIVRTNGMELLATEAGPDWRLYDGTFEGSVTAEARTNEEATVVVASADELKRNEESAPDPNRRFHYRYQAAALAWEAAKLMPNNSDDTARLLCQAGSWLKAQDPDAADLFYKTLVRRCRKTDIGAEADEIHWFPDFDADGNLIRTRLETLDPPTTEELAGADAISRYPTPGKYFLVQPGDHIRYMASAVRRLGIAMTAKDIFTANPEITPDDNIAGRLVFVPVPGSDSRPPMPPLPVVEEAPLDDPMPTPPDSSEESPAVLPAPVPVGTDYTIRAGDTLAGIAKQSGVTLRDLLQANPDLNVRRMKVGQSISIPTSPTE